MVRWREKASTIHSDIWGSEHYYHALEENEARHADRLCPQDGPGALGNI
jgi:hypothetical protein